MIYPFVRRVLVCLLIAATASPALAQPGLRARMLTSGLAVPVAFVQDPSNPRVQYIVQQTGRIRVLVDSVLQPVDFLDLSGQITSSGEQGLLGLAFPADYGTSGRCYVNFTDTAGDTVVARFLRSRSNALVADLASRFDLRWSNGLRKILQPYTNHNGGTLRFGPDGYLYVGMGDGGGGDDPDNRAQDPTSLLGKMLRIDEKVFDDDPAGTRIPPTNPFLDGQPVAALPEIYAFGLRNPWKFSFDDPRLGGTGALIIGDVGQGAREEIDYVPADTGGRNFGWPMREGTIAGASAADTPAYLPLTEPVYDYPRTVGRSVTGGVVYRGAALGPGYWGRYFLADFVTGRVFSFWLDVDPTTGEAAATDPREHTQELGGPSQLGNVSAIEVDSLGELHVVNYAAGTILKIEPAVVDADADGLPDEWERRFGLDAQSAIADEGRDGDPDGDGLTNVEEFETGGHPRGLYKRYLAEGATSAFFDMSVNLVNPTDATATVVSTFQNSRGPNVTQTYLVPPMRRLSIDPKGQLGTGTSEFSTLIESDTPIVASRSMVWDVADRYGSHAERAVDSPSPQWFLAEGATHSGFQLFYLLQNPNETATSVEVTYLLPSPLAPLVRTYDVPASTRRNVWVNIESPLLASTDVSATVRTLDGQAIVVERAMYLDTQGQLFGAGHDGVGATAAATEWFLAEGSTGSFFDLFVLVANPDTTPATVEFRFLLSNGEEVIRTRTVGSRSRDTVWVDLEDPRLADAAVSTVVRSTNGVGIIVERAMWWQGSVPTWREAHVSLGSTVTSPNWCLAEGEVSRSGGHAADTYVLVANLGESTETVTFTLLFEDRPPAVQRRDVAPGSRFTLNVDASFAEVVGRRFGVMVQGASRSAALVTEGAVYSDSRGVFWAAGSNLLATPLP